MILIAFKLRADIAANVDNDVIDTAILPIDGESTDTDTNTDTDIITDHDNDEDDNIDNHNGNKSSLDHLFDFLCFC